MILPCIYGIAFYLKKVAEDRLYEKISQGGTAAFSSAGELENAIYLIMEYLESPNPMTHSKFQGMILANEERVLEETASYYRAIAFVINTHDKLINDIDVEADPVEELDYSIRSRNNNDVEES